MTHPFLEHAWLPGPLPIAHRGYSARFPENTYEAYEAAYNLGYRYLETDVHATADGKLVAFHDDDLDRVTESTGRISALEWNEIRRIKVGGTAHIPLLQDLFLSWPDARFIIDPKEDSAVEPLFGVLKETDVWDRVCVGSFSDQRLDWLRNEAGPKLCTSMGPNELLRMRLASVGLPFQNIRAMCVQAPLRHRGLPVITRRFLNAVHKRGLSVQAWTINDRATMERLLDLGIDAIMSDESDLLKSVFMERGYWPTDG